MADLMDQAITNENAELATLGDLKQKIADEIAALNAAQTPTTDPRLSSLVDAQGKVQAALAASIALFPAPAPTPTTP